MTRLQNRPPADPAELRRALYVGDIFLLPATDASGRVAREVHTLLRAALEVDDVRHAHRLLAEEDFFARIGRVRRTLFTEPRWHAAVREVVAACGVEPGQVAFDPIRLRVVAPRGHENPRAQAVYYAHRDTWYAHPQSIITWWIALDDLAEEETFVFYPERFARAVPNNSEIFDYGAWVRKDWNLKIGWQDRNAGLQARYPGVVGEPDPGHELGFSCLRGENLLFSGAHFHQTRKQATGRTRYSLDFRIVHLADHAQGLAAPNVDNRSRGSAFIDYVQPEPTWISTSLGATV
jgi:hypothetical protein